jgi:hypothetical protein
MAMDEMEKRLLGLARELEPLPDIRELAQRPQGMSDLDVLMAMLDRLTRYTQARELSAEWDAVDHIGVRLVLHTLAGVAAELRRAAHTGSALFDSAHGSLQHAKDALARCERAFESVGAQRGPVEPDA